MQLNITFENEKIELPICTNTVIQGFLYNALREDSEYSSYVHNNGKCFDERHYKLFTFSELQGRYVVEGKNIIFLSQAGLSVRSADSYLIQLLFSHLSKKGEAVIGDNCVKISNLQLSEENIYNDEIVVRTLSPITVYITESDGHTVYFNPDDERFYKGIVSNARRKWCSVYGKDAPFNLEVTPVNDRFVKRATNFKGTFITAWHGVFRLKASPEILTFLYRTGLGSRNSQGFGMTELVK